jgi:hypothetical protein
MAGVMALLKHAMEHDKGGEAWPSDLQSDDGDERLRSWHYFLVESVAEILPGIVGGVMDRLNLEASINDLTNMAEISGLLTVQLADTLHEAAKAGIWGKQAIETHQWLVDLVSFATLETKLKAEELRKQFYAKTEEDGLFGDSKCA